MRQNGKFDDGIFGVVRCVSLAFALCKAAKKTDCGHWSFVSSALLLIHWPEHCVRTEVPFRESDAPGTP